MERIAAKQLTQLLDRAKASGIQLSLPKELAAILGGSCHKQGGARQIRHLVQERVESPLSVFLLQCTKKPAKIRGELVDGQLQFFG